MAVGAIKNGFEDQNLKLVFTIFKLFSATSEKLRLVVPHFKYLLTEWLFMIPLVASL